jgi:hypothetical protein
MKTDLKRLKEAVRTGKCRLDPYLQGKEVSGFGAASLAGGAY